MLKVVSQLVECDYKYKGVLGAAGSVILWSCDRNHDMLKKVELTEKFS